MTQVLGIAIGIAGRPWEGGPWGYEKSERYSAVLTDELRSCYPGVEHISVRDTGGMDDPAGCIRVAVDLEGDEDLRGGTVAFAEAMQSDERVAVRDSVTALARSLWIENQWLGEAEMSIVMTDRMLAMIDQP